MLLMEPAIALKAFTVHYVKISAVMELMEKTAQGSATAPQVTPAIISAVNASNVQITHLVTNVNKLVTAMRMELLSVLMLMGDVSVKQTGLEANAI